jgi:hypothetical protein
VDRFKLLIIGKNMREFILHGDGSVVDESAYRARHVNVSFPESFTCLDDASEVFPSEPPALSEHQRAERDGVVLRRSRYVWKWKIVNVDPGEIAALDAAAKAAKKSNSIEELKNLVVTVEGRRYQADRDSLQAIMVKIMELDSMGLDETVWRLADNTSQSVSISELKKVVATASNARSAIILAS